MRATSEGVGAILRRPRKMLYMRLTEEGRTRLHDFVRFGRALIKSQDIDPLYPVLHYLQRNMSVEQGLWHSFLYVAWYHLPSATAAFDLCPIPHNRLVKEFDPSWPTGIERRANRGGQVGPHIASYLHFVGGSQLHWLAQGLVYHPDKEKRQANWRIVNDRLQEVYGNGRWAAYKHCEVLRRVNGFPIEAPDMGHQFSTGPREGLEMLYGPLEGEKREVIEELDRRGEDLRRRLRASKFRVDIEELETILCNWKSLVKGKYYVGHDIDELQEQMEKAHDGGIINLVQERLIEQARSQVLPRAYLGEVHGWSGIQKDRMKAYRDRGKILVRKEN